MLYLPFDKFAYIQNKLKTLHNSDIIYIEKKTNQVQTPIALSARILVHKGTIQLGKFTE